MPSLTLMASKSHYKKVRELLLLQQQQQNNTITRSVDSIITDGVAGLTEPNLMDSA